MWVTDVSAVDLAVTSQPPGAHYKSVYVIRVRSKMPHVEKWKFLMLYVIRTN